MIPTTLTKEVLQKYRNDIFVETGTATGSGVKLALELGFKMIYSIELGARLQAKNAEQFKDFGNVKLFTGESISLLSEIIKQLDSKATFWLDAHSGKLKQAPIYRELEVINQSSIKNHTIMIDDMRVIGKSTWGKGLNKNILIEKLLSINSLYTITYENNTLAENDIMVAHEKNN